MKVNNIDQANIDILGSFLVSAVKSGQKSLRCTINSRRKIVECNNNEFKRWLLVLHGASLVETLHDEIIKHEKKPRKSYFFEVLHEMVKHLVEVSVERRDGIFVFRISVKR